MTEKHWAIFALRDIQNALDGEKYEIASYHIKDAIEAILDTDTNTQAQTRVMLSTHCTCFARRA